MLEAKLAPEDETMPENCLICDKPEEAGVKVRRTAHDVHVECPQCGKYETEALIDFPESLSTRDCRIALSCATRQAFEESGSPLRITQANAEAHARAHSGIRVLHNLERLLQQIATKAKRPHHSAKFSPQTDFTLIDCSGAQEFGWYAESLKKALLIDEDYTQTTLELHLRLTVEGWNRVYPLPRPGGIPGRCFVAMSFDASLDNVFDLGISLAVTDAGFPLPMRIDRKHHNNQITDEIIAAVRDAHFVIADFTGNRAGVYYEAGFARGLGRPVIYCCRDLDVKNLHFDTKIISHVVWSDVLELRKKLAERIKTTILPQA
jgi:hypothetical protein